MKTKFDYGTYAELLRNPYRFECAPACGIRVAGSLAFDSEAGLLYFPLLSTFSAKHRLKLWMRLAFAALHSGRPVRPCAFEIVKGRVQALSAYEMTPEEAERRLRLLSVFYVAGRTRLLPLFPNASGAYAEKMKRSVFVLLNSPETLAGFGGGERIPEWDRFEFPSCFASEEETASYWDAEKKFTVSTERKPADIEDPAIACCFRSEDFQNPRFHREFAFLSLLVYGIPGPVEEEAPAAAESGKRKKRKERSGE